MEREENKLMIKVDVEQAREEAVPSQEATKIEPRTPLHFVVVTPHHLREVEKP